MNSYAVRQNLDILLVEDNPGDLYLISEAFSRSSVPHTIYSVTDGEAALAFLQRKGEYVLAPHPHLMLLDLNLPRKNGMEVLREMKTFERLKMIPVVVFTSSREERDVIDSYKLCASSFVTKPLNLAEFSQAVQSIENFWLKTAQLPPIG